MDDLVSVAVTNFYRHGVPTRQKQYRNWYDEETVEHLLVKPHETMLVCAYALYVGAKRLERLEFPVRVWWDACRFGGRRPYLGCGECSARVMKLYLDDARLVCRRCARLLYRSQTLTRRRRLLAQAGEIRRQLGGEPEPGSAWGTKPKFMHRKTFEARKQRALALEAAAVEMTGPRV